MRCELGLRLGQQRRQPVDRHAMLAGGVAQREQPLLDALQRTRTLEHLAQSGIDRGLGLAQLRQRPVQRLDGRLQQLGRQSGIALQPALGRTHPLDRTAVPGECLDRLAECCGELVPVHEALARLGQLLLLAGLGVEVGELALAVAEIVLLAPCRLDLTGQRLQPLHGVLPGLPGRAHGGQLRPQPAERVEQQAMLAGVEQAGLRELAVHLDQQIAKLAQEPGADRDVVDEGAAAAVGVQRAAQDQLVGRHVVLGQELEGRVVACHLELGADRPLLRPGADERALGAAAQRQTQGVEQDRLAGPGLAGERGEPLSQIELEPLDQHDVADLEAPQHSHSRCRWQGSMWLRRGG